MIRRAAPALLAVVATLAGCGGGDRPAMPPARTVAAAPSAAPAAVAATVVPPPRGRRPEFLSAGLLRATTLRTRPGGPALGRLARKTPFGSPRILSVVGQRGAWLRVLDANLPHGASGWISARDVLMYPVDWRVDVSLTARQVTVRRGGRVARRFVVAIGRPTNPTPPGRYAVTDKVRMRDPGGPYGCCALALTGHQPNVPQGWGGGDRLAIHGTDAPGSIGLAASLGCLRAGDGDVHWIVTHVPLGTPVFIRA
ncbi:MAG TPA: L,D-transpeptidase [Solirubrobacteraceae bacterium]|jgi:lipoprotein-anchoring transpeptidase ErfK/SrfK